ncbi:MAG: hypothetical protein JXR20_12395 [Balneola sp.]
MKSTLAFLFFVFFLSSCDSNRILKQLTHPITDEVVTLLILGGISDDYTYVIQGEYKSNEIKKGNVFVAFRDSFGISYNDTSWVIYHLGDIEEQNDLDRMNITFHKLNKVEYSNLIDSSETEFIYRYYF